MQFPWYRSVPADVCLDQGDIVERCPVIRWCDEAPANGSEGVPDSWAVWGKLDLIVMTQACDLAQQNIKSVVMCPLYTLEKYKPFWEKVQRESSQNPTNKAWQSFLNRVKNNFEYHLALLNEDECEGELVPCRLVDFHEVYTLPRAFLEGWLVQRNQSRVGLNSPYREYLSQRFAYFFSRVALPTPLVAGSLPSQSR